MISSHPSREPEHDSHYLPQYGFGPTTDFSSLVESNQFLFRVYTPKERSPFFDESEPFFIAPRFDERYRNVSPGGPKNWDLDGPIAIANATYQDVARHMDWTTRSLSPYISSSFSAIWSIWEALRRYHHGVKQDIQIAVIDAQAVADRAVTAVYLLNKASPQERLEGHWKWFRFAQESQAVLVFGAIPGTAVLASVPISDLLRKMPSYFLKEREGPCNPFNRIAWDYTERKPNFRLFCSEMSNNFLRLAPEERLRDATTNSVELAAALLRPWFRQEHDSAVAKLSVLGFLISQWPCQWWVLGHKEVWNLILSTAHAVVEELQMQNKAKEVASLREVVEELEHTLVEYDGQLRHARSQAVKYYKLASSLKQWTVEGGLRVPLDSVIIPTPHPSSEAEGYKMWTAEKSQAPQQESPSTQILNALPKYSETRTVDETLISLPESPVIPSSSILSLESGLLTPQASPESKRGQLLDETKIPLPESPTEDNSSPNAILESISSSLSIPPASPRPRPALLPLQLRQLPPNEGDNLSSPGASSTMSTLQGDEDETSTVLSTPPGKEIELPEILPLKIRDLHTTTLRLQVDKDSTAESVDLDDYVWIPETELSPIQKLPVFVEAASYVATGFLVGALITFCLLAHRRIPPLLSAT